MNDKDDLDTMFMEIIANDGFKLSKIDGELFRNVIYPLFVERFKNQKFD